MNITIISGSPRKGSLTNRIALHLQQHFRNNTNHHIQFISLQENNLPQLQSVWSSVEKAPVQFQALAQIVFDTDAFVLVSPEYNGSYSASIKNLLDHFPKQHHKPFGIVTGSPGALGGIRAAIQMQALTAALFGILSPYMLLVPLADKKFDENGTLTDAAFSNSVHQFTTEFLWLAESIAVKELQLA